MHKLMIKTSEIEMSAGKRMSMLEGMSTVLYCTVCIVCVLDYGVEREKLLKIPTRMR